MQTNTISDVLCRHTTLLYANTALDLFIEMFGEQDLFIEMFGEQDFDDSIQGQAAACDA